MLNLTEISILKSRAGVYQDTPENRRLHRVGMKYGAEKTQDTSEPKNPKSSLGKIFIGVKELIDKGSFKGKKRKAIEEVISGIITKHNVSSKDFYAIEKEYLPSSPISYFELKKGAITFEDIKEAVDSREPQELKLAIEGFSIEGKSYEELDEIQEFAKKKGDSLVDSDNYYTSRTGEELLSLHRKIYKKLYDDPQESRGRAVDNTQSMAKEGKENKSKKEKSGSTTKDKFRSQLWKMEDLAEDTEALAEALDVDAEEDEQYLSEAQAIFDDVVDAVYDTIKDIGDKDALDFDAMTKKVVDSVKEIAKGKPDYLTDSEYFNNWSDMLMVFKDIWDASVKKPFPLEFGKYFIK